MIYMRTTTLTRSQFDTGCKSLISGKYFRGHYGILGVEGWSWNEHPSVSGFGYMSRNVYLTRREDAGIEVEHEEEYESYDEATLAPGVHEVLDCQQYVVYSSTFQVPAFYFTIHGSNGSPLPLENIIKTSLFHHDCLAGTEATTFALGLPSSSFPLLSQGDHPTLGTPSWYIHPCETAESVAELLREMDCERWTDEEYLTRWIETWFMVLGTIVSLG